MIRRKKYLIKKGLQFRYIGTILAVVFFIALVCTATTYYSLLVLLGEKLANVYPQGRLAITLKNVNVIVLYRVLLLIPFVTIVGLILSHRIAGPVFRIEAVLQDIGKGNLDVKVSLRKRDELKDLAETVNTMTDDLKDIRASRQKAIKELTGNTKELLLKDPVDKRAIEKNLDSIIQKTS